MKKRIGFITKILIVLALIAAPVLYSTTLDKDSVGSKNFVTINVAGAITGADYTYVNPNADVAFNAAIAALPATGGTLEILSSGTIKFNAAVTVNKPNVIIAGSGLGTAFTFNGALPPFIAGANGLVFQNCSFDIAPNTGATTLWSWSNVKVGATLYDFKNTAYSVIGGAVIASSVTVSGLTNTRVPFVTAGGLLTDSASFTLIGSTLSVPTITATTLNAPSGRQMYTIAASDASSLIKAQADIVLTGTGDQTAINTAFATYSNVFISGGRGTTVYISGPILTPNANDFSFTSDGVQIYLTNGSNSVMVRKNNQGATNYRGKIAGFLLNGNSANNGTGTYGIDFTGMESVTCENVLIADTKSHGFYSNNTNGIRLVGTTAQSCKGWGYFLSNLAGGLFERVVTNTNTSGGFTIQVGYECFGSELAFDQDTGDSINLAGVSRSTFSNVWTAPNSAFHYGLDFYNCKDVVINGGSFFPVVGADVNTRGVAFLADGQNSVNIVLNNFHFDGSQASLNSCVAQSEAGGGTLVNNKLVNCSFTGFGSILTTSLGRIICENNIGFIAPGETRTTSGSLTAGVANAFAFAWQNPEGQTVIIKSITIQIVTPGGAINSVIDVGSAANATTHGTDLIVSGDLNTAGFLASTNLVILDANGGATDWITGQILIANAGTLAGKFYITYVGQ